MRFFYSNNKLICIALLTSLVLTIYSANVDAYGLSCVVLKESLTEDLQDDHPSEQNEEKDRSRYTVLVLDCSDVEQFIYTEQRFMFFDVGEEKTYVSDSSIDSVKEAAKQFVEDAQYSIDTNYIAVVAFDNEATVMSEFSTDQDALTRAIDSIQIEENSDRSIHSGLVCANELLSQVQDEDAVKNVLLCTTGLTNWGEFNYEGHYNSETVGSNWYNTSTDEKLYAYANMAIEAADQIKQEDVAIYVIGIFAPVESKMPNEVKGIASFFRMTAKDLASSENTYIEVEYSWDEIEFGFRELSDAVIGTSLQKIYLNDNLPVKNECVNRDDQGGELGYSGIYEEILWGPSLFEIPSTKIWGSSMSDPNSVNYNLAMLGGCLSTAATNHNYLVQMYRDLGIEDEDIYLYSYPDSDHNKSDALRNGKRFAEDEDLAFSIASRSMVINGTDTDVIMINARGTMTPWEAVNDAVTGHSHKINNKYIAYDWPWEFEEDIMAGWDYYMEQHPDLGKRPMKIYICGHSLGGSAANLTAAVFNKKAEDSVYGDYLLQDDIYAYTYGAIDSIVKDGDLFTSYSLPVSEGYDNIINIYNELDTFGPEGNGYKGINTAGNTIYGKFGLFYMFREDMSSIITDSSECKNHEIIGYVTEIRIKTPSFSQRKNGKRLIIRCPIDVIVYYNDKTVCMIQNDTVISTDADVAACVDQETKIICIPDGMNVDDITVEITATDSGTMSYYLQDLDYEGMDGCSFTNVVLSKNKKFRTDLNSELGEVNMFVIDGEGNTIAEVLEDGHEEIMEIEVETEITTTEVEEMTDTSELVTNPAIDRDSDEWKNGLMRRIVIWELICVAFGILLTIMFMVIIKNLRSRS